MSTSLHSLFRVALHQSHLLQHISHQSSHVKVHVEPLHTRLSLFYDEVVACFHNLIDFKLTWCELTRNRSHARIVRTIVVICFSTRITEHQSACFEGTGRRHTVLDFSMHREDVEEGSAITMAVCHAFHQACNVLFRHAWLACLHCSGMHLITNFHGAFNFLHLFWSLDGTHLHHRLDEFYACFLASFERMETEQIGKQNHVVVAVRRKEMNLLALCLGCIHKFLQVGTWSSMGNTHTFCIFLDGWHIAEPHNIVDVDFIAEQIFLVVVDVNHRS